MRVRIEDVAKAAAVSRQTVSRVIGMDKASVSRCFKSMQESGLIRIALDNGRPRQMGLKDALMAFIAFRLLHRQGERPDVTVCDINPAMLEVGRDRAVDRGLLIQRDAQGQVTHYWLCAVVGVVASVLAYYLAQHVKVHTAEQAAL